MRVREQEALRRRIGRNLRAARTVLGLSQHDLAERAEIADKYLSRVELGTVTPSILVAYRLARAVGIGVDALIGAEAPSVDARVGALVATLQRRGPADVERAIRVLQALADGP
jgi:transcriptional regulator with XRE-family HTH domain